MNGVTRDNAQFVFFVRAGETGRTIRYVIRTNTPMQANTLASLARSMTVDTTAYLLVRGLLVGRSLPIDRGAAELDLYNAN